MKKLVTQIALAILLVVGAAALFLGFSSPVAAEKPATQCAAKARTVAAVDVVYWLDLFNTIGCEQTVVTNVGGGEYHLQPVHHD